MEHHLVIEAESELSRAHYEHAWELLHLAPEASRGTPGALKVKLRVCQERRDWRTGSATAARITSDFDLEYREVAGRFRLAHCSALCDMGFLTEARSVLFAVFKVWPEGREEVVSHPAIKNLWN